MSPVQRLSYQRTWQELGGMLCLAFAALACVAVMNHSLVSMPLAPLPVTPVSAPIPDLPQPAQGFTITSPVDGIYQAGNTPGGPPLVKVGSHVKPETLLGKVQPLDATALPILAGMSGTVKEIYVQDAGMVSEGEALMRIEVMQMPQPAE